MWKIRALPQGLSYQKHEESAAAETSPKEKKLGAGGRETN